MHELTIAEAAYLAALPKGPNNYNPFRHRDEAIERRNYVIDRMVEDGYVTAADGDKAKKEPLNVTVRPTGAHIFAAEYFAEEVRRYIYEKYGEKKLYEGGLSVRTTLDPKMQVLARKTMTDGLVNFDEAQGYRGPVTKIEHRAAIGASSSPTSSRCPTSSRGGSRSCSRSSDQSARIGLQPARDPGGAVVKAARSRHRAARRREVGEARERAGEADPARQPGAVARRRHLRRAARRSRASSGCARCRKFPARWW